MANATETAHGVDSLIARLRDEGVAAGKVEAEKLIAEARAESERLVAKAAEEADALRAAARKDAERYEAGGKDAIDAAMRDAVLTMKTQTMARFERDVRRLTAKHLSDPALIKQMILELVGTVRDHTASKAGAALILPAKVVGSAAIHDNADNVQADALTDFVLGLSKEMLEDGVTLHVAETLQGGIHVKLADGEVIIDLSDAAIESLLLEHLQPRFRAVLEGVIR